MMSRNFDRLATLAIATMLLPLTATPLYAQDDSYDCVMEAKSTIELQSAEEGILDQILVSRAATG